MLERPPILPLLLTVVLTAFLLVILPSPLTPDISGQLWIAHQMRRGAELYVDISEINPPLWFWMAMPIDGLAEASHLRPETILILAVSCAALCSVWTTDRLLAPLAPGRRAALMLYAVVILLVMPARDFGQREHLALIGALPYVALVVARREQRAVSGWLAGAVGIIAASGFALKHYFLGVPLLLECWLMAGLGRRWRPVRPETVMLVAGAAIYALAILWLTPGYLQVSVPETLLAYAAFGAPSLHHMIRPAQPIWMLVACGILAQRPLRHYRRLPLTTGLLIGATGFAAAWLIQHKGWPYQSMPTTGLLALAMAAILVERAQHEPVRARALAIAALILPVMLAMLPTQWVTAPEDDIAPALADLRPGATVAIVSAEARTAWRSTVNRGFRFSGRRGTYWIFAAIDANRAGAHDPRIDALGAAIVRQTVIDYRCLPPVRLIFARPYSSGEGNTASGAPLRYFLRDRDFAALLSHYKRLDISGNFDAFQLVKPLKAVPADQCPRQP